MRYLLCLLLVALPASASPGVVHHPDGSATISKEVKEAIVQLHDAQTMRIQQLEEALKKAGAPGKCI